MFVEIELIKLCKDWCIYEALWFNLYNLTFILSGWLSASCIICVEEIWVSSPSDGLVDWTKIVSHRWLKWNPKWDETGSVRPRPSVRLLCEGSHQQRLTVGGSFAVFLPVSFQRTDSFVTIAELFIQIAAALHPRRQTRNTSACEGRISLKPSVKPIRSDYMPGVFNKEAKTESCFSSSSNPFNTYQLDFLSTRPARCCLFAFSLDSATRSLVRRI